MMTQNCETHRTMSSTNEPWPADALSTVDELLVELDLDAAALDIEPTSPAMRRFRLRVPRGFVTLSA
jgi:hypothetical protein